MKRNQTKQIHIGSVTIGGGNPIAVQSMCNTITSDTCATIAQIHDLEKAGCQIIRVAVPDHAAAMAIREIKESIHIPLVADIHFDYRLAIEAIEMGADKIRINPGNIGSRNHVREVVEAANAYRIPIRIGVNSGSLEKDILSRDGRVTAQGIADSALRSISLMEDLGFDNLVISIKSSSVPLCIRAHEILAERISYPFHIGITETGTEYAGTIKSAVGLGVLLYQGLGDTMRVSLTADPLREVACAKQILKSLGLVHSGIELISCPTCGRTRIDLIGLAQQVEALIAPYEQDLKVAVMGCVVNGPGEAREADLGIAGGVGEGLIFRKGEVIRKVPENELLTAFQEELEKLL